MKSSINPFIRAHGAAPGPLMRPLLTGFLSSQLAGALIIIFLIQMNAMNRLELRWGWVPVLSILAVYCACAGWLYGRVYRRAANDRKGGWLFGASTGFVLWMVNPIIWLPYFGYQPVFVGLPAIIFMVTHTLHGAMMGFFFPWMHFLCKRRKSFSDLNLAT